MKNYTGEKHWRFKNTNPSIDGYLYKGKKNGPFVFRDIEGKPIYNVQYEDDALVDNVKTFNDTEALSSEYNIEDNGIKSATHFFGNEKIADFNITPKTFNSLTHTDYNLPAINEYFHTTPKVTVTEREVDSFVLYVPIVFGTPEPRGVNQFTIDGSDATTFSRDTSFRFKHTINDQEVELQDIYTRFVMGIRVRTADLDRMWKESTSREMFDSKMIEYINLGERVRTQSYVVDDKCDDIVNITHEHFATGPLVSRKLEFLENPVIFPGTTFGWYAGGSYKDMLKGTLFIKRTQLWDQQLNPTYETLAYLSRPDERLNFRPHGGAFIPFRSDYNGYYAPTNTEVAYTAQFANYASTPDAIIAADYNMSVTLKTFNDSLLNFYWWEVKGIEIEPSGRRNEFETILKFRSSVNNTWGWDANASRDGVDHRSTTGHGEVHIVGFGEGSLPYYIFPTKLNPNNRYMINARLCTPLSCTDWMDMSHQGNLEEYLKVYRYNSPDYNDRFDWSWASKYKLDRSSLDSTVIRDYWDSHIFRWKKTRFYSIQNQSALRGLYAALPLYLSNIKSQNRAKTIEFYSKYSNSPFVLFNKPYTSQKYLSLTTGGATSKAFEYTVTNVEYPEHPSVTYPGTTWELVSTDFILTPGKIKYSLATINTPEVTINYENTYATKHDIPFTVDIDVRNVETKYIQLYRAVAYGVAITEAGKHYYKKVVLPIDNQGHAHILDGRVVFPTFITSGKRYDIYVYITTAFGSSKEANVGINMQNIFKISNAKKNTPQYQALFDWSQMLNYYPEEESVIRELAAETFKDESRVYLWRRISEVNKKGPYIYRDEFTEYKDGKQARTGNYTIHKNQYDDVYCALNGKDTIYNPDGEHPMIEREFKDGKMSDTIKFYNPDGELWETIKLNPDKTLKEGLKENITPDGWDIVNKMHYTANIDHPFTNNPITPSLSEPSFDIITPSDFPAPAHTDSSSVTPNVVVTKSFIKGDTNNVVTDVHDIVVNICWGKLANGDKYWTKTIIKNNDPKHFNLKSNVFTAKNVITETYENTVKHIQTDIDVLKHLSSEANGLKIYGNMEIELDAASGYILKNVYWGADVRYGINTRMGVMPERKEIWITLFPSKSKGFITEGKVSDLTDINKKATYSVGVSLDGWSTVTEENNVFNISDSIAAKGSSIKFALPKMYDADMGIIFGTVVMDQFHKKTENRKYYLNVRYLDDATINEMSNAPSIIPYIDKLDVVVSIDGRKLRLNADSGRNVVVDSEIKAAILAGKASIAVLPHFKTIVKDVNPYTPDDFINIEVHWGRVNNTQEEKISTIKVNLRDYWELRHNSTNYGIRVADNKKISELYLGHILTRWDDSINSSFNTQTGLAAPSDFATIISYANTNLDLSDFVAPNNEWPGFTAEPIEEYNISGIPINNMLKAVARIAYVVGEYTCVDTLTGIGTYGIPVDTILAKPDKTYKIYTINRKPVNISTVATLADGTTPITTAPKKIFTLDTSSINGDVITAINTMETNLRVRLTYGSELRFLGRQLMETLLTEANRVNEYGANKLAYNKLIVSRLKDSDYIDSANVLSFYPNLDHRLNDILKPATHEKVKSYFYRESNKTTDSLLDIAPYENRPLRETIDDNLLFTGYNTSYRIYFELSPTERRDPNPYVSTDRITIKWHFGDATPARTGYTIMDKSIRNIWQDFRNKGEVKDGQTLAEAFPNGINIDINHLIEELIKTNGVEVIKQMATEFKYVDRVMSRTSSVIEEVMPPEASTTVLRKPTNVKIGVEKKHALFKSALSEIPHMKEAFRISDAKYEELTRALNADTLDYDTEYTEEYTKIMLNVFRCLTLPSYLYYAEKEGDSNDILAPDTDYTIKEEDGTLNLKITDKVINHSVWVHTSHGGVDSCYYPLYRVGSTPDTLEEIHYTTLPESYNPTTITVKGFYEDVTTAKNVVMNNIEITTIGDKFIENAIGDNKMNGKVYDKIDEINRTMMLRIIFSHSDLTPELYINRINKNGSPTSDNLPTDQAIRDAISKYYHAHSINEYALDIGRYDIAELTTLCDKVNEVWRDVYYDAKTKDVAEADKKLKFNIYDSVRLAGKHKFNFEGDRKNVKTGDIPSNRTTVSEPRNLTRN